MRQVSCGFGTFGCQKTWLCDTMWGCSCFHVSWCLQVPGRYNVPHRWQPTKTCSFQSKGYNMIYWYASLFYHSSKPRRKEPDKEIICATFVVPKIYLLQWRFWDGFVRLSKVPSIAGFPFSGSGLGMSTGFDVLIMFWWRQFWRWWKVSVVLLSVDESENWWM